MTRKVFSIPVDLHARLEKYANEKGMKHAEVIRRALMIYLAGKVPPIKR